MRGERKNFAAVVASGKMFAMSEKTSEKMTSERRAKKTKIAG